MPVHPLIFEPILRPKVWGGNRLRELLGRPVPAGAAIGESWECADLPEASSVVAAGPARGRTLAQLVREWGADLLGRAPLAGGRFPLLIKYLDARQPLSIQVHPGSAARDVGPADIKHEAWYVLEADPQAVIYRGVHPGTTREQLAAAAHDGSIPQLLETLHPRVGDSLYCPGGTIHALGGGLVVAEVQTPSDVTYRLFDWNRARPAADAGMHVEQGVAVAELTPCDRLAERRTHVGGLFTTVTRLVDCPAFRIEKVRFSEGMEQEMPYAGMVLWVVLEGRGAVLDAAGPATPFRRGDVVLLPAAMRGGRLRTESDCVWLEVTVPAASDLAAFPRPDAAALRDEGESGRMPGVIPLNVRREK